MSDKQQDINRLYNDYEDSIFALAAAEATELIGNKLLIENEQLRNQYIPSNKQERILSLKVSAALCKNKWRQLGRKILPAVVAAMILLIILSFTPIGKAIATQFKNLWLEVRPNSTDFHYSEPYQNEQQWHNCYLPNYIPSGYKLSNDYVFSNNYIDLTFENNKTKKTIYYISSNNNEILLSLDGENAEKTEVININGCEGHLLIKLPFYYIVWQDGNRIFYVATNISAEITKQIARSVCFIE